jgi:hypothetical protein
MGHHLVGQYTTPPFSTALECGAAAVGVRTAPDYMMAELHEDSFRVFPLRGLSLHSTERRPVHALRNADPFELKESSGRSCGLGHRQHRLAADRLRGQACGLHVEFGIRNPV